MKPLPEAVRRAFPCAPGRLPERPWWVEAEEYGGKPRFRRQEDDRQRYTDLHIVHLTLEQVAAHDAAHPLPHPGYRAGQVWAAEDGESTTILRAIGTQVCVADNPKAVPPHDFDRAYPYLMADPSCPYLAPWSPAEVKP